MMYLCPQADVKNQKRKIERKSLLGNFVNETTFSLSRKTSFVLKGEGPINFLCVINNHFITKKCAGSGNRKISIVMNMSF